MFRRIREVTDLGRIPAWMLFQCAAGNRWSSTTEDASQNPCNFSGCDCKGKVTKVNVTLNRNEAGEWFHRETNSFAS